MKTIRRLRLRAVLLLLVLLSILALFLTTMIFQALQADYISPSYQKSINAIYATNTAVRLLIDVTQTAGAAQTQTAIGGK